MRNRHIRRLHVLREHPEPKLSRYLAMLFADAICRAAHSQGERCHAKRFGIITNVDAAKVEKLILGKFQARDKVCVKAVTKLGCGECIVSGGDRSVRCKDASRSNRF